MIIILPVAIIVGILAWIFRPQKGIARGRAFAILATAIPSVIMFIAATVSQLLYNAAGNEGVSDVANICFIVIVGLIVATILALAGFIIVRKIEIAKGIGFGLTMVMFLSIVDLALLGWLGGF